MSKTILFAALAASSIDKTAGSILGVSVISEGEAKGHDLFIDATTIIQVKGAAEQFADGLQVKIDHWSGFDGIVGVLKNFIIDGTQLRADLSLLQNHDARDRILEMAETMPGSFGLSIAFSGDHEVKEVDSEVGKIEATFARCLEIYSADLVDSPAANPSGLFSEHAAVLEVLNVELPALRLKAGKVDELTITLTARDLEITNLKADKARLEGDQERINGLYGALKKSLGLNPAAVVPPIAPGAPEGGTLVEQYLAMPKGTKRQEFFQKHKTVLMEAGSSSEN